jgi:transketolase
LAVDGDGPVALVLTRQGVEVLEHTAERAPEGVARGGYVLCEADGGPAQVVLVSTGSEVGVCVAARALLAERGVTARVVSLPSWDRFEAQDEEYRRSVLPAGVPTLSVEAASSFGWSRYADDSVAIDTFGASAPGEVALAEFGFTPEHVAERAAALLAT